LDDQREDSEKNDHDREDCDDSDAAGDRIQFLFDHLAEGFATPAHGSEKDHEILDRASESDADQNPDGAGKVTKLRGEDGADKRAGAGNGGEVVAEDDPLVGFDEVAPVIMDFAGSGATVVQDKDLSRNPF